MMSSRAQTCERTSGYAGGRGAECRNIHTRAASHERRGVYFKDCTATAGVPRLSQPRQARAAARVPSLAPSQRGCLVAPISAAGVSRCQCTRMLRCSLARD